MRAPSAWLLLVLAGLFEVGWAVGLKYTDGFTRFWPSVWTIGALIVSFVMLSIATRALPIGTAYAVWTGIGAIGTALVAASLLGESLGPLKILCLASIVAGIAGLRALP